MEPSSLRKNRPHLEAVLGPLSAQDDASVRAIFDEVDGGLLEIARHFGGDRAGWEGTGLELTWMASGQVDISSHVGACIDSNKCVTFCIELQPSWYFGERTSTMTWEIVTEIEADCQHAVYCRSMHSVHRTSARALTVLEAASALHAAVRELLRLATEFPLEHWLQRAGDRDASP
jgi:hypothetical protein